MIRTRKQKLSGHDNIPEKLFYKIGETARIVGVEPYVLRYWESEFPFLKPRKSRSGQRLYVRKDLDLILEIKRLLYEERYTIEGVKKRFSEPSLHIVESKKISSIKEQREIISRVKSRLREIIDQF
jgi:DNA-binding transcriptional MerR regulator